MNTCVEKKKKNNDYYFINYQTRKLILKLKMIKM